LIAEPVEPVVCAGGLAPGDGQLRPKAPVPAPCASLEGHLDFNGIDAGGKGSERRQSRPFRGNSVTVVDSIWSLIVDEVSSICGAASVTWTV